MVFYSLNFDFLFELCNVQIMTLLHRGNLNRTTEPTRVNETSSRSHAILQVRVKLRFTW